LRAEVAEPLAPEEFAVMFAGKVLSVAAALLLAAPAVAIEAVDAKKDLRLLEQGIRIPLRIPGAKYRVAVFAYEDPDDTKLGDDLAAVVSREVLLYSGVSSIGVLKYEGDLSPAANEKLSYFDKVEKLTASQETILSLWGMIRRRGDRLVIDSFVQIPPDVAERSLSWHLKLPRQMGGEELRGHVGPDRIFVQSLEVPLTSAAALHELARSLEELRASPEGSAPVAGRMRQGSVYRFTEWRGDWVFVDAGELKGWARAAPNCPGACAKLRDASRFASGVLSYLADGKVPPVAASLEADARIFRDQLVAVAAVEHPEGFNYSSFVSRHWSGDANARPRAAPGGASFENLRAALRIAFTLYEQRPRLPLEPDMDANRWYGYSQQTLERAFVRDVAFDLAEASQDDPRNLDVLHNLEVLFRYAGDEQRAEAARAIAAGIAAR
jgi:hypothetical protein